MPKTNDINIFHQRTRLLRTILRHLTPLRNFLPKAPPQASFRHDHDAVIGVLAAAWQPRSCRFMLLRTLNALPHPGCGHL